MTLSPKLTVFDMDGTFIHAEHEFFFGVANRIFSEMSLPARDPEIMKQFISESRFFDILEKDKTQEVLSRFWDIYNQTVEPPQARVILGAHEAIEHCLQNGSIVALATARPWPESQVRAHLEETALLNKMSVISTWHGTDWTDKKSQLLQVCKQLDIDPALSAKVGDLPSDISSACAAGFGLAVSVLTGSIKPAILENASKPYSLNTKHIIIKDISELGEHLFPT